MNSHRHKFTYTYKLTYIHTHTYIKKTQKVCRFEY